MRIKRDNKAQIEEWMKTHEIKKLKSNIPNQCPWSHVNQQMTGFWSHKNTSAKTVSKSKKKRGSANRTRESEEKLRLSRKQYKQRIIKFKAKRLNRALDMEMNRAMEIDK